MPDTKTSALTDGATLQDTDWFPAQRSTGNVKLSGAQIKAAVSGDGNQAAAYAAAAAASASSAAASAVSSNESSNETIFATRAAADAGLAGLAANSFAQVLVDESQTNQRTRYQKVSGAYVFVRTLGDLTQIQLTERTGYGPRARNTMTTLSMLDRQAFGPNGPGNPRALPATITASQSGTTVTATAAIFTKEHIGNIIVWAAGEEALITDVNNAAATWTAITTCTVDRSQTVASGSAKVDAKSLVGVDFGNSVAYGLIAVLVRRWYRAFGFGGYVFRPNGVDTTFLSIGEVALAGGASEATPTNEMATIPWSSYWLLPTGGSVGVSMMQPVVNGVAPEYRFGLKQETVMHDTAIVVWQRAAGAITVERKRFHDATWELVDTVSDTSTGSRNFNFKKYSHALAYNWQYRVTATSGPVKVVQMSLLNRTTPGYVHWPLSRGGNQIANFNAISSAALKELCEINTPDFRVICTAEAGSADASTYVTTLTTDRDLWAAVAPRCDSVRVGLWTVAESSDAGGLKQRAWNAVCQSMAFSSDEPYVSFDSLHGVYATSSAARGWLRDSIHSSRKGEAITAQRVDEVLGISAHPQAAEGRNVNARSVSADDLFSRGRDIPAEMALLRLRSDRVARGALWTFGATGTLQCAAGLSAAIGTNDFTLLLDHDVLSSPTTQRLALLGGSDATVVSGAGTLLVAREGQGLNIYLSNGSNNSYKYSFAYFGSSYNAGQRRKLVIRSNRANGRFDLFLDGLPMMFGQSDGTVLAGSGTSLATWSGSGQALHIPQSTTAGHCSTFYGAMFWPSALTDAQIYAASLTDQPPSGATPDFWYDFSEGGGRIVLDRSGNGRDAMFRGGTPGEYNIGSGPTWQGYTRREFWVPWNATLGATSVLIAGDDVTHSQAGARDYLLPASPRFGDKVRVTKAAAQTIRITQPALHQIRTAAGGTAGTNATTAGTGGSITIVGAYDSVTLMCTRSQPGVAFEWGVVSASSALTWT